MSDQLRTAGVRTPIETIVREVDYTSVDRASDSSQFQAPVDRPCFREKNDIVRNSRRVSGIRVNELPRMIQPSGFAPCYMEYRNGCGCTHQRTNSSRIRLESPQNAIGSWAG